MPGAIGGAPLSAPSRPSSSAISGSAACIGYKSSTSRLPYSAIGGSANSCGLTSVFRSSTSLVTPGRFTASLMP